ncbi:MAG: TetR/AcrR family transcriptional regulator [Calditrichia bacterium]
MPNQDKKYEIKNAARQLFHRFGLHKTNMDDIAQAAGMAKPTLYYYYKSKEDLFNEIVLEDSIEFLNNIQKQVPPNLPADQKLQKFMELVYINLEEMAGQISVVDVHICHSLPHGEPIVQKIGQIASDYIKPVLEEGIKANIFSITNVDVTIKSLLMMTHFLNIPWIKEVPKKERDDIFKATVSIIISGLKRRDS